VPAIMPERLAASSPFKPVAEIVGSGPYASYRTSISAAPARPMSASRVISPARAARWASPPGRSSRVSIGSSG
jgi:hypothetical protein